MFYTLTDQSHFMLELIAEGPILASPEIERYTAPLAATKLITLNGDGEWRITALGHALLERPKHRLH
jgi:hypothetical protein